MNQEVRQLLVRLGFVVATMGAIWFGATVTASDIAVRHKCYQEGVAGLPQGVDQTLLQTQSNAYKTCLSLNSGK